MPKWTWYLDGDVLIRWCKFTNKAVERTIETEEGIRFVKALAVEQTAERVKDSERRRIDAEHWDKEQKLTGWVAILGTALFIFLIFAFQGGCNS